MISIVIVDDHPVLRDGLQIVFNQEEDLEACGSGGTIEEVIDLVEQLDPDLVLSDLEHAGRNGIELIKELKLIRPALPVLVLTLHDEFLYAERVLRAGGRGFVPKEAPLSVLFQAVRCVLAGGLFVAEPITRASPAGQAVSRLKRLTALELELFHLIGSGEKDSKIAGILGIRRSALADHKIHLRDKLGIRNGSELTRAAVRWIESSILD